MELVDANVILRYLLKDHKKLYPKSIQIIEEKEIFIPSEVVAETVYVLEKVYEIPRIEISEALRKLFEYSNIMLAEPMVIVESLQISEIENIDFVDAVLVSYHRVHNYVIHSFDKKINKLCYRE